MMLRSRSSILKRRKLVRTALLLSVLPGLARPAFAQEADGTRERVQVAGSVTVTSKGISTIPSFTLGKPAAIFDLAIRKGELGFEPQFRFGLDGKPWSFLFWRRYRLREGEKLRVAIGAHPALSFRTLRDSASGTPGELIVARRYLAGEVNSSYSISRNASVGPYYLYSYGVEKNVARHTHFLALRAQLGGLVLSDRYQVRLAPQVYYLRVDGRDGYYLNVGATLARQGLPVSLSTMANGVIRTRIPEGERFLWNVSVNYALR